MTPEEFTQLLKQQASAGPFRIPLTMVTFEAIRAMSEQQAKEVRDAQKVAKSSVLLEQKQSLTKALADVQAQIDVVQQDVVVDGGIV